MFVVGGWEEVWPKLPDVVAEFDPLDVFGRFLSSYSLGDIGSLVY